MKSLRLGVAATILLTAHALSADDVFPGSAWQRKPPSELGLDAARLEAVATALGGRGCIIKQGYLVHAWGDQAEKRDWLSSAKPVAEEIGGGSRRATAAPC
ncbi:MAG: hypothetical protein HY000_04155 [Planctomycetes bacterium]|nr:hypothetical protein [Planctomycetota bacterium]